MSAELRPFATLADIRERLHTREITARELVEAQLERARTLQETLNTFITITAGQARRQAERADAAAARGEWLGPLHGVPITLKDIVGTRGIRTTAGSRILADFVPDEDAAAAHRLLSAGAVLLGKTNLHELAYGVTNENPHYGPARNPWDPTRVSGGSSGGSAVALAAGIGYGSVGTDTGGSIRIPSALCGTVGLKPTYGRVSRYGVIPLAWSLDHVGPMARTVKDVAILYELLAGHDPRDPSSSKRPVEPVADRLDDMPSGVKLGVPGSYFFDELHEEVRVAVDAALGALESLGLERVDVTLPDVEHQSTVRNVIGFAEASAYHQRDVRERPEELGAGPRELLRIGLLLRATDYIDAQRARRRLVESFREAFRSVDLLVSPAVVAPAPPIGADRLDNGEPVRTGLLRLPSPFNTTGFPAVAVPCGFTRSGLPIGLQLAARPFEEALLLRVAHAYEIRQPWHERRPARFAAEDGPRDIVRASGGEDAPRG